MPLTACKQYCLAPAHAVQHKATSPTRKSLESISVTRSVYPDHWSA